MSHASLEDLAKRANAKDAAALQQLKEALPSPLDGPSEAEAALRDKKFSNLIYLLTLRTGELAPQVIGFSVRKKKSTEVGQLLQDTFLELMQRDQGHPHSLLRFILTRPYPTATFTFSNLPSVVCAKLLEIAVARLVFDLEALWTEVVRVLRGHDIMMTLRRVLKNVDQKTHSEGISLLLKSLRSSICLHDYLFLLLDLKVSSTLEAQVGWNEAQRYSDELAWLDVDLLMVCLTKLKPQTNVSLQTACLFRPLILGLDEIDLAKIFKQLLGLFSDEPFSRYCAPQADYFVMYLICLVIGLLDKQDLTQHEISVLQEGIVLRTVEGRKTQPVYRAALGVWRSMIARLDKDMLKELPEIERFDFETVWTLNRAEVFRPEKLEATEGEEPAPEAPQEEEPEAESEFVSFDFMRQDEEKHHFKYLYQCVLSLRSDDLERVKSTLKDLPYIVIKNVAHLGSIGSDLIDALLMMPHRQHIEDYEEKKDFCLVVLLFCSPDSFCKSFLKRFFKGDCSLGERVNLLSTLNKALWEILGKKNKLPFYKQLLEELDQQENEQSRQGILGIQIVDDDEARKSRVEESRSQKIESQSRRWGYAKLGSKASLEAASQKFKILEATFVDRVLERCKPLYLMIFLSLLDYAKAQPALFLQNSVLLASLYQLLATFCQVSKHAVGYCDIANSICEYLDVFEPKREVHFDKDMWRTRLMLLLSLLLSVTGKVAVSHQSFFKNLIRIVEATIRMKQKIEDYPDLKPILYQITERFANLL